MRKWIANKPINPHARLRVFAFPCAGAGAGYFRNWAGYFPADVDWLPVQLPGRETRFSEPRCESLDQLLPALARGLSPFLDKPFIFFGHSLGALLAFELARKFQAENRPGPQHLLAAAFRAPHLASEHAPWHLLPEAEFIDALLKIGGIPEPLLQNRELLSLVAAIARSDFKLHETYSYQPGPLLAVSLTVLGGGEDPFIRPDMLEAWKQETMGTFHLHLLPGNHHFLQAQAARIAGKILESGHPQQPAGG